MASRRFPRIGAGEGDDLAASRLVVGGDQVFLAGCSGVTDDGGFVGESDPAAQAEHALATVRARLEEAGGSMRDVCMVTNYTTRHAFRDLVYPVIARHVAGVNPVSTGLVVPSLGDRRADFEIEAWAVLPADRQRGHERFRLTNARGGFLMPSLDYGNARIVRANEHLFLQGQTGMTLDGRDFVGAGDPALQAQTAIDNVRELLADAGADLSHICKVTTYLTNPAYDELVYPVLGRALGDVRPVTTHTVVSELARPELDLEIDVFAMLGDGPHERLRPTEEAGGWPVSQVVRSGRFVFVAGQTGRGLGGGADAGDGDPAAQAQRSMQDLRRLLEEGGGGLDDVCKVTIYVTDGGQLPAVRRVVGGYLRDTAPAVTEVVMAGLAAPGVDVTIDAFAVIG